MKDQHSSPSPNLRGVALIATAIGAVAVGAFAIGALAIGRLAIRRVVIDSAKLKYPRDSGPYRDAASRRRSHRQRFPQSTGR